jgi:hypothetical protein
MRLEDQLKVLAGLGLPLAPGRTAYDLLYSLPREEYERRPFDMLVFMLGAEVEAPPWGRWFCDRAWSFDTECIDDPGSYVEIASQLSRISGRPDGLTEVRDHVDVRRREAWIEYSVGPRRQRWDIEVNDDWADLMVVSCLMGELEHDG